MRLWRAVVFLCLAGWVGCGPSGEPDSQAAREQEIALGRKLFISNGCHVCHGQEGKGDGPLSRTLNPPPRDFGDLAAYRRGPGLAQLEETIEKGMGQESMPPYPHIPSEDRRRLALFIQSLQPQPQSPKER